ncbi:MAG: hypothetical protein AAGA85_15195 [Bacteroidota bacterium]
MTAKAHKIIVWSLIIVAVVIFWISLRTDEYELEYTLAALGVWGIAYLINRMGRK